MGSCGGRTRSSNRPPLSSGRSSTADPASDPLRRRASRSIRRGRADLQGAPDRPIHYYAARSRALSPRAVRDAELLVEIERVHRANFGVYGVEKVWRQLLREGVEVGRDRVARLMTAQGLRGVRRGKFKRTTIADEHGPRPADLVDRNFSAAAPNRLWLADITYVSTWSGFRYTAFITDAFSRAIVGWRVAKTLRADLALDALEQAIWTRTRDERADVANLIHHSGRGVQ